MTRAEVMALVEAERDRQEVKWGRPHSWGFGSCDSLRVEPPVKVMVLTEECGEVARAVLDRDDDNLREELVQVAAVAVAWLESM